MTARFVLGLDRDGLRICVVDERYGFSSNVVGTEIVDLASAALRHGRADWIARSKRRLKLATVVVMDSPV